MKSGNRAVKAPTRSAKREAKPIPPKRHLPALGAYGFDDVETVILAALVTEDPLLLIGNSGTGKTFLLNSISEALSLEHRHYNASLVSFDDLVGFPFPDDEKTCVRFLETPATVWGAESVLIDEISRCRPEHQNRLFSLIQERRVQGISLDKLRFRWAAMNPASMDQGGDYIGSEPLDRALADRFALIVRVGDWEDLSAEDRRRVADPAGEGLQSDDGGALARALAGWRQRFVEMLPNCPAMIVDYADAATTALNQGRLRISPRRSRMLSRSLLAATVVAGGTPHSALFRKVLECSIPHPAWGEPARPEAVMAAHQTAWAMVTAEGEKRWIHEFHLASALADKAAKLMDGCPSPDAGTTAVCQFLASDDPGRAAAFALALYPAAAAGLVKGLGAEAVADLGRVAQPALDVDSEMEWKEITTDHGTDHPYRTRWASHLDSLEGCRRERAKQLFCHLLTSGHVAMPFDRLEAELEATVRVVAAGVSA